MTAKSIKDIFSVSAEKKADSGILLLIAVFMIMFYAFLYNPIEYNDYQLIDVSYLILPLATASISFVVSYKYGFSEIFGKTFFGFGMAMVFFFLGEFTYEYYEYVIEEAPFPSIADIFYILVEIFLIYSIANNIRFFQEHISKKFVFLLGLMIITIPITYLTLPYVAEIDQEIFEYGFIFIVLLSITFTLSFFALIVTSKTAIRFAWFWFFLSIVVFTIADAYYYYLETVYAYDEYHFVNGVWIFGYCLMIYALFKHIKAI